MPWIIIPLCEKYLSWAFHVFIIVFFKGHMPACIRTGNLRMHYNHPSVCRFGSCSISYFYLVFFFKIFHHLNFQ